MESNLHHNVSREDVVITGISCRFAEAVDPAAFWCHILQRQTLFTPLAPDETFASRAPNPFKRPLPGAMAALGRLYAYLPSDLHLSISPVDGVNPDLFFVMQLISDALRDSQSPDRAAPPTNRVSLRLGYPPPFNPSSVNWLQHTFFLNQTVEILQRIFPSVTREQLADIRARLTQSLPPLTTQSTYSSLACTMAAEIAQHFEFAGPATFIESGALSAHAAFEEAIDDLLSRRADVAVTGAVQPPLTPSMLQGLSGGITFTPGTTMQPFSRDASGTLPGEGGAIFVLKRLKDAEKARDRIYAIVRSVGTVSPYQRNSKRAFGEWLSRAITRSLTMADVAADSIAYIETAAGGDPVLDKAEVDVLFSIYGTRRAETPLVGLGAAKANYGNTLWASGAASMLKAALALYHQVLPANPEILKPFPRLASAHSPLYLLTESRPWLCGGQGAVRRAGVTCISVTGGCGAAILEAYQ